MTTAPRRKDAVQRRQAILVAAEAIFAEQGIDVALEDICVAASIGRGTLYRNFANRTELIHAIMFDNLDKLAALAEAQADNPEGLQLYLAETLAQQVRCGPVFYAVVREDSMSERYFDGMLKLLPRAIAAGAVRADVEAGMIGVLVRMMWGGLANLGPAERQAQAPQILDLVMRALRP